MAPGHTGGTVARGLVVVRAVGSVFAIRDVARVERGWAFAVGGGLVETVAMLAYTYATGGARLVAVYGVARTLPPALVTPWVMGLVTRTRRESLLRWTTTGRAVLLTATSIAVLLSLPPAVAVVLVGASASLSGCYRPLQADMLPWLVHTPAQLGASNATATLMENAASLVGPALGGLMLAVADVPAALAVAAVSMWGAALSVLRVRLPDESRAAVDERPVRASRWAAAAALFRVLPHGGAAVLIFLQTFTRGLLMVLIVVLAVSDLRIGEESVGWLTAAIGLGGIIGGLVAVAAMRITRLTRAFGLGVALWGVALLLVWAWPTTPVALLAFVIVGIGNAAEDGSMFTLLPRVIDRSLSAGALGTLEVIAFSGSALGALAAPSLGAALGTTPALGVVGAATLTGALLWARSCVTLDRTVRAPGPELDLIRSLPMFAPLPVVTLECLVDGADVHHYQPGEAVMSEGEPGDSLHVIEKGEASVTVRGTPHPRLGPGDAFGEIALLRDVPRTATVTAATPLRTLRLRRPDFLRVVAGNRVSAQLAEGLASARLAADSTSPQVSPGAEPEPTQD
jgi:hypothetical protein